VNRPLVPLVRFLMGLRRPHPTTNAQRLRARGESPASFRIRLAQLEDADAIAEVHVAAFNTTHGLPWGQHPSLELRRRQWREKLAAPSSRFFGYVVEKPDEQLVGFATGEPWDYPGDFAGRLEKIYLLEEYQRLGFGRRLVGQVSRRLLGDGITSMILFSQAENPSIGFFEALGGERLLSDAGEFHGAYGWRDLQQLSACT
jgi:L-amino acid N-acyltransferase YncA